MTKQQIIESLTISDLIKEQAAELAKRKNVYAKIIKSIKDDCEAGNVSKLYLEKKRNQLLKQYFCAELILQTLKEIEASEQQETTDSEV